MTTRWMDSPIGGLRLHANAGLITAIDFDARPLRSRAADPLLDDAERQLTEYFAGDRTTFDLPLASEGSEFQKKVWGELQRIPFGETASYGDVARRLGYEPVISRAVGAANGANPIPIHRALPPRHRFQWHSDRIRRRHRAQEDTPRTGAARPVLTRWAMTKFLIMLVLLVPAGFLVWDVADAFLGDTKTEREVMGDNFLEHDRYADALEELITEHGGSTAVLHVYVDIRSAQVHVVMGATTAKVEGFGQRGGGEAEVGGSPVDDYERRISADEVPTGTLGIVDAPRAAPDRRRPRVAGRRHRPDRLHATGRPCVVDPRLDRPGRQHRQRTVVRQPRGLRGAPSGRLSQEARRRLWLSRSAAAATAGACMRPG